MAATFKGKTCILIAATTRVGLIQALGIRRTDDGRHRTSRAFIDALKPKETAVRTLILVSALIALGAAGLAQPANSAPADKAPIVVPAADLAWKDLDPVGAPGVKVATLWGDIAKGPFGAIFKLPPGFVAPLHTHTYDMKLVIISGTYIQAPKGKAEFRLGPNSYLLQPGGNYQHITSCDKSAPCIFFVESDGAFDLKPVPKGQGPDA